MRKVIATLSFILFISLVILSGSRASDAASSNSKFDNIINQKILEDLQKGDIKSFQDLAQKDATQAISFIETNMMDKLDRNSLFYPQKVSMQDIAFSVIRHDYMVEGEVKEEFAGLLKEKEVTKIILSASFNGVGRFYTLGLNGYQVGDLIIAQDFEGIGAVKDENVSAKPADPENTKLLIVLANGSDDATKFDKDQIQHLFFNDLNEYFSKQPENKIKLSGDVYESKNVIKSCDPAFSVDSATINQELMDNLVKDNVKLDDYDQLIVINHCDGVGDFSYVGSDSASFVFIGMSNNIPNMALLAVTIGGQLTAPLLACNQIYLTAGDKPGVMDEYQDVWSYNSILNTWNQSSTPLWPRRKLHSSVVFQNKLWVIGGFSTHFGHAYNDIWSYDGITWTQHANAPWLPKYLIGAVVFNNKIWIIGGTTPNAPQNDVWSFDGTTWTHEPNPPWSPRFAIKPVVFHNKIWMIGGASPGWNKEVWSFDGTTWTHEPNAPWAPVYMRGEETVVFHDKIWLLSGTNWGSFHEIWSFDGTTWIHEPNAPWAMRFGQRAVVFNGRIWVMSGEVNANLLKDVWSFDGTTWTQEANAPWGERRFAAAVVYNSCQVDIAVTKSIATSTQANGYITYTIQIKNLGMIPGHNIVVSDMLPNHIHYILHTITVGATYNSITGLINIGILNAGATVTLKIKAGFDSILNPYNAINTAQLISLQEPDSNPNNNVSSASFQWSGH